MEIITLCIEISQASNLVEIVSVQQESTISVSLHNLFDVVHMTLCS